MPQKINIDHLKTSLVATTGPVLPFEKDVNDKLGELLQAVQETKVYGDGKTFVDLVPSKRLNAIKQEYALLKNDPHFDLREFIARRFYDATEGVYPRIYTADPEKSPLQHVENLWSFLERKNRLTRGSLLALPYPYIVPGGRFNEQFYWDSYFIMLGLAADDKWDTITGMVKNYAYQIRKYGYIPSANRSYLLSRSQPPFFSHMVRLLQQHKGKGALREYLPYLLLEYRFWMKGRLKLATAENRAYRRLVQVPSGALLNRYYDNKSTPRPESLREDIETAKNSGRPDTGRLYLHIRAAAESGWDFSSRWFSDPSDIKSIHTADIIPVDLNALLYHLEETIADAYKASFNMIGERTFRRKARQRQQALNQYSWDEKTGFYRDYNFHHDTITPVRSLAAAFPLYVGMASQEQADKVARTLRKEFLKKGGLITTIETTGQQWDAPNGWAPLQWVAIQGLRRYGHDDLAQMIESRWLALNETVYETSHKFVEKYNVESDDGLGGGGEYSLQDGFGWTNGVYAALKKAYRPLF